MRPDESIQYWEGDKYELDEGLTLLRLGGHFTGGTVLHWANGAEGQGVILSGDILQVTNDRRYVSFMCSFPPVSYTKHEPPGRKFSAGRFELDPHRYKKVALTGSMSNHAVRKFITDQLSNNTQKDGYGSEYL